MICRCRTLGRKPLWSWTCASIATFWPGPILPKKADWFTAGDRPCAWRPRLTDEPVEVFRYLGSQPRLEQTELAEYITRSTPYEISLTVQPTRPVRSPRRIIVLTNKFTDALTMLALRGRPGVGGGGRNSALDSGRVDAVVFNVRIRRSSAVGTDPDTRGRERPPARCLGRRSPSIRRCPTTPYLRKPWSCWVRVIARCTC